MPVNYIPPSIIEALSIFRDEDGSVVQLDGRNISPDSESYQREKIVGTHARGGHRKRNERHTLQISFNDPTIYNSLQNFDDNTRRYQACIVSRSGANLFWYELETITVEENHQADPEAEDYYPYSLRMRHVGYNPGISAGINILTTANEAQNRLARGWYDADGDGIADGYSVISGTPTWDANRTPPEQILQSASEDIRMNLVFPFPVSGIKLTASIEYVTLHTAGDTKTILYNRDYNNNVLLTDDTTISSTGRVTITTTTDPNVYKLFFDLTRVQNITADDSMRITAPAIRADGSNEWTP